MLLIARLLGNIGRMGKTLVSGHRGGWFKPSALPVSCVLDLVTFSALLQSTRPTNEYQTGTSS